MPTLPTGGQRGRPRLQPNESAGGLCGQGWGYLLTRAPRQDAHARVEAATREAYIRVLLDALNKWAAAPNDDERVRMVHARLRQYREAVSLGLFEPKGTRAFSRGERGGLPPGEMQAALRMVSFGERRSGQKTQLGRP